jgi:ATP-dependent Clp protease ATP-binding subunit ClpC
MFEYFTAKAVKVIMLSHEEAHRLGHNFIGTELILVGLIGEETGVAAKVLRSMGVNLTSARIEVENRIGRGSGYTAIEIPFTPAAKRVLEFAQAEAEELGHNYLGTEHLLLGLIGEGESIATKVLETLGVDLTKVRPQVMRMLGEATEVSIAPEFSTVNTPQSEIILLLQSIEAKIVAIDLAVGELKADVATLRRNMNRTK